MENKNYNNSSIALYLTTTDKTVKMQEFLDITQENAMRVLEILETTENLTEEERETKKQVESTLDMFATYEALKGTTTDEDIKKELKKIH